MRDAAGMHKKGGSPCQVIQRYEMDSVALRMMDEIMST